MKRIFALAVFTAATLFADAAQAMYISDDHGGRIGDYVDKYTWARRSGETVVIDGPCLSACTLVTGIVPKNRICVTRNAALGFHRAYDIDRRTQAIKGNPAATRVLYAMYPHDVRSWVGKRGGLTPKLKVLEGAQLQRMYRLCP